VSEQSEDGCPCRSEDDPVLSPTHGPTKHKGTGTIRSDIRVPERSEGGFPCRSEDMYRFLFYVFR